MGKKNFRGRGGGGEGGGQGGGGRGRGGRGRGGGQGGGSQNNGRGRGRRRGGGGQRRGEGGEVEPVEDNDIPSEPGQGLLELHPNGYGFLRSSDNNYSRERSDPFVPGAMIEKFGLRQGVLISGIIQHARKQQGPRLREITDVDGLKPDEYSNVKNFDSLTAINPVQ
ncbi:MAG: transcription termination factor Rho, partial [Planctomycetes bacterium]|nr:transcription termination factor Rho [Planctomycetota bacterium]